MDLEEIYKYKGQFNLSFRYACPKNSYRWGAIPYFSDLIPNFGLFGFKGKVQVWAGKTTFPLCNKGVVKGYSGYIGDVFRTGRIAVFSKPIKIPKDFYYYDYGKGQFANSVSVYFPKNFDISFCNDFALVVFDWDNFCWKKVDVKANCFFYNSFALSYSNPYVNEVKLGVYVMDIYGRYYEGGLLVKFSTIDEILVNDYFLNRLANAIGLNIPKHLNKILKIIGG